MRKKVSATRNAEIKKIIHDHGVRNWEVANELGIHEENFSRMLRFELSKAEMSRIIRAVHKIEKERGSEA